MVGVSLGTVYQLVPPTKTSPNWSAKLAYVFSDYPGGVYPAGALVSDKAGNLYGGTFGGGIAPPYNNTGNGVLYKLTPPTGSQNSWSKQTIYVFQTPVSPLVKLAIDAAGNLYLPSSGNVLKFTPPKTGSGPYTMTAIPIVAGYLADQTSSVIVYLGKLYGVAESVSTAAPAYDIVYQLTPPTASGTQWTSRTLQSFASNAAVGQLALSANATLFGSTSPVGTGCDAANCAVFELLEGATGLWTEKIVHSFAGDPLGSPMSNIPYETYVPNDYQISFGPDGSIYGGIIPSQSQGSAANSTIYRLTPPKQGQSAWTETALYTFQGSPTGFVAGTPMLVARNGTVYGTAYGGSRVSGTVYWQSIAFKIVVP